MQMFRGEDEGEKKKAAYQALGWDKIDPRMCLLSLLLLLRLLLLRLPCLPIGISNDHRDAIPRSITHTGIPRPKTLSCQPRG
jgi:hypothetical protein